MHLLVSVAARNSRFPSAFQKGYTWASPVLKLRMLMRLTFFFLLFFVFSCSDSRNVNERLNKPGVQQNRLQPLGHCLKRGADETLSVATWNLQDFPKSGLQTINSVGHVIIEANWDILAIQELTSRKALQDLVRAVNGRAGFDKFKAEITTNSFFPVGLLYNQERLSLVASQEIFSDNRFAFPRPALWNQFEVKESGQLFSVLNVHLKCCRGVGNRNRRLEAIKLIDQFVQSRKEEMIILGDFNHDVIPARSDSPYRVFLDNGHYKIADLEIALGDSQYWSYPKGPYHLDHIILTGPLIHQKVSVDTSAIDKCRSDYYEIFSDHRPVGVELSL